MVCDTSNCWGRQEYCDKNEYKFMRDKYSLPSRLLFNHVVLLPTPGFIPITGASPSTSILLWQFDPKRNILKFKSWELFIPKHTATFQRKKFSIRSYLRASIVAKPAKRNNTSVVLGSWRIVTRPILLVTWRSNSGFDKLTPTRFNYTYSS